MGGLAGMEDVLYERAHTLLWTSEYNRVEVDGRGKWGGSDRLRRGEWRGRRSLIIESSSCDRAIFGYINKCVVMYCFEE